MADETKFSVLCSLFNWIQKTKSSVKKRSKFRKYLDTFCESKHYFSSIRLILPNLDRERGTYGLKESVLATCLIDALGMSRDSEDAVRLINWRKGGPKTGANVGNFALVAAEILQRRQGMISGDLTIKELNELLDRLAASENRAEKTSVLSTLIKKTNAQEMKWIVMIILKDMKLGISEKSIFHEFHPDAEDLFNVTCDLKLVCEKLSNKSQRHKRQDIEVGKPVRPQLALRVGNVNAAWKKLVGKEVVVECKFDGDRIQIHKYGSEIHYFSRNFLDHPEYEHAMSNIIIENILVDKCILDGEMLVWDSTLNRFAEFGSNQEIAKAAKEGLESGRQICYVAFDILYAGDTSVIHQTLKERHALLQKIVKPLKGRLEILVPNSGLNVNRPSGEPCWSRIAHNADEIEKFFKETVENRDEGIVLKDLGSKWEPSDRSGKWMKLKPDYVHPGSDLDVLIIGGYYGSGRRGGEVAQFLVGLAESTSSGTYPRRFISFCRVGTGLSDDQLDTLVTKLKPFFKKNEYPKKSPPSYYEVTNNSKERPDVWIDSPEKSVILSITSDIRTIRSDVFAAPYNLRFPRIDQVRYDKPWFECLDIQSFIELVHSSNGTTQRKDYGGGAISQPKSRKTSKRGEKKSYSVVPPHFIQTDVSNIKGESMIFSNMMFYFVNVPPTHSLDALHKLVVENGGTFSMNLNNAVTHSVAAESKGIKYHAAKLRGDIFDCSWVLDSCTQKKLLPLQPKYFLFLSEASKKKLQEDKCSVSFDQDLDIADLKNLLNNVDKTEETQIIDYYKIKFCPKAKWGRFHNCSVLFLLPAQHVDAELEDVLKLSMRRMKLEVCTGGGKISDDLFHATHLVVLSWPEVSVNLATIVKTFPTSEKRLLYNKRLHIVGSQWLEDCFEKNQKVEEDAYSMKSSNLDLSDIEKDNEDIDLHSHSHLDKADGLIKSSSLNKVDENLRHARVLKKTASPEKDHKSERGRPTEKNTTKGRPRVSHVQRTRTRIGKKHAKIAQDISENSASSEEETKSKGSSFVSYGAMGKENSELWKHEIAEDSKGSAIQKVEGENKSEAASNLNRQYETNFEGLKPEKLEVMVDPIQAMLLDMIPSLGMKRVEATTSVIENDNLSTEPTEEPVKKRKVSYKDVADELLKKW